MYDLDDTVICCATDERESPHVTRRPGHPQDLPAPREPVTWDRFLTGLLRALSAWPT